MSVVKNSSLPALGAPATSTAARTGVARGLAGAVLLALLPWNTPAAQDTGAPDPGGARYVVEIIVFRHLDQRGNSPEVALQAAGTTPLATGSPAPVSGEAATGTGDPAALVPTSLQLGGVAARLRRNGNYELLYHGGWTQEVAGQNGATPVPLPPDAVHAGAAGTVTLYRERYLHALVDIGLAGEDRSFDELRRIRQGRRLRGQAIQYFDSPLMGVILAARSISDRTVVESGD